MPRPPGLKMGHEDLWQPFNIDLGTCDPAARESSRVVPFPSLLVLKVPDYNPMTLWAIHMHFLLAPKRWEVKTVP